MTPLQQSPETMDGLNNPLGEAGKASFATAMLAHSLHRMPGPPCRNRVGRSPGLPLPRELARPLPLSACHLTYAGRPRQRQEKRDNSPACRKPGDLAVATGSRRSHLELQLCYASHRTPLA